MNVEARRVRKHVGIVVRGKRRRPYHHALEDGCASDLGVAGGDAREGKIAITGEAKAFLERVRNKQRVADQLVQLLRVRVEQVEGTARRTARCRQRGATDAKNLVEQLAVTELVALIAGVDEIADEVRARAYAPLFDNGLDFFHGAIEGAPQFRGPRLARLDVGGAWDDIVERDEDRLAALVHIYHGIQQGIDDEMGPIVLHAVELGAVCLDAVEHAIDDTGDTILKLLYPPRRKCRQQQATDTSMLLAVHLGDELGEHDLVELLPARATRHLRLEGLSVRKHAMHVGVAADHHLWRTFTEYVEWRPSRPFCHVAVRVRLELDAAEIHVDDVGAIQFRRQ